MWLVVSIRQFSKPWMCGCSRPSPKTMFGIFPSSQRKIYKRPSSSHLLVASHFVVAFSWRLLAVACGRLLLSLLSGWCLWVRFFNQDRKLSAAFADWWKIQNEQWREHAFAPSSPLSGTFYGVCGKVWKLQCISGEEGKKVKILLGPPPSPPDLWWGVVGAKSLRTKKKVHMPCGWCVTYPRWLHLFNTDCVHEKMQ